MATIITRAGKGALLTSAEVDSNFTNLNAGLLQAGLEVSAVAPANPADGKLWFDITSGLLLMYISGVWAECGGANMAVAATIPTLPGMLGWYDFSDTSSLTLNGSKISVIADKSGAGRNLTQATDVSRWTTGGNVNGLNAAICANAQTYSWGAAEPALATNGYYAFAVFSASNDTILLDGNGVGVNPYLFSPRLGGPAYCSTPDGNFSVAPVAATLTDTQVDLYSMVVNTVNATFELNGTSTSAALRTGFTLKVFGGRGSFQNARNVCEVIIGNAVLTAQQIADTKAYLKAKWNTP